jgi:hypothetical protein
MHQIIDHGTIVEIDTPQSLIEKYRENAAVMQSPGGENNAEDVFIGLPAKPFHKIK